MGSRAIHLSGNFVGGFALDDFDGLKEFHHSTLKATMFLATRMSIMLLISFTGMAPGIGSNSHLSTTCMHVGMHTKKKKPRYLSDNGAFHFNDEVRSGLQPSDGGSRLWLSVSSDGQDQGGLLTTGTKDCASLRSPCFFVLVAPASSKLERPHGA